MGKQVCCVCHKEVGEEAPRIGRRAYCEEHYAKVQRDRGSVWRTSLLVLVGLVVFAGAVALLDKWINMSLEGPLLVLAGVILALIPAAIWLVFFYLQDLLEPEPKHYVMGVFLIGALLASAVGIPVVRSLFRVQDWLGTNLLVNLLGSILVVGFTQEFLKYAAVRYSVYRAGLCHHAQYPVRGEQRRRGSGHGGGAHRDYRTGPGQFCGYQRFFPGASQV